MVNRLAYSIGVYDKEEIIDKLVGAKYISFDIFDTLIKRKSGSNYNLFECIENEKKILNFKEERICAEKKARKYFRKEISVEDIYSFYNVGEAERERIMQTELEFEYTHCYANNTMKDVYEWCLKNEKKIICISDMYFHEDFLSDLLYFNDYKNIDYIFVSSDIGKTKKSGKMFSYVRKKLNLKNSDIVHIGDSLCSDYIMPFFYGIKSVKIPRNSSNKI